MVDGTLVPASGTGGRVTHIGRVAVAEGLATGVGVLQCAAVVVAPSARGGDGDGIAAHHGRAAIVGQVFPVEHLIAVGVFDGEGEGAGAGADRNFRRAFGNQVTEITQLTVEGRFWGADGVGASGEAGPRSFWS